MRFDGVTAILWYIFDQHLICFTGRPALSFVVRPVLAAACHSPTQWVDQCEFLGTEAPLQLPGFGVEMAIKNMEYSALDDSKVRFKVGQGLGFRVVQVPYATCITFEYMLVCRNSHFK